MLMLLVPPFCHVLAVRMTVMALVASERHKVTSYTSLLSSAHSMEGAMSIPNVDEISGVPRYANGALELSFDSSDFLQSSADDREDVVVSSDQEISEASGKDDVSYFAMRGCSFDEHEESLHLLGNSDDFRISKMYHVPPEGFINFEKLLSSALSPHDIDRLGLTYDNVTLPVALMALDPDQYPTLSRSRKACRKGSILLHKGPLSSWSDTPTDANSVTSPFASLPKAGTDSRVQPNDVIARQVRTGGGFYPSLNYARPPFELPVVYEDDFFAIVQKPCGIVVYSHRNQGSGTLNVRSALPFVLRPPRRGTMEILRRPQPVHRLDKPTSGLLLVAKTKPAHTDLTRQFVHRVIRKTYCAIVNGIPDEPMENRLSSDQAYQLGVDVAPTGTGEDCWQIIDFPLDDGDSLKSAVTVWRALKYVPSLVAEQGTLTLLELKPKTGRYHQLRQHLSMVTNTPIVGDKRYDGGSQSSLKLRARGMFLCSNKVVLEHPFYNSDHGRKEWNGLQLDGDGKFQHEGSVYRIWHDQKSDKVMVEAEITLPTKFHAFLQNEEERYHRVSSRSSSMDDSMDGIDTSES